MARKDRIGVDVGVHLSGDWLPDLRRVFLPELSQLFSYSLGPSLQELPQTP